MIRKIGKVIGDFLESVDDDLYIGGIFVLIVVFLSVFFFFNVF